MSGISRRVVLLKSALVAAAGIVPAAVVTAQENPPAKPITIPCATMASSQVLGMSPAGDGSQSMVLARVILAPGGSIGAHTHPGTVVATVESGTLGFTHLGDREMVVTRAETADSEAVEEPLPHGEEVAFNPGDWYVETGMVHTATNLSDGETTVVLTGLIPTGEPLTICVESGATTNEGMAYGNSLRDRT